MLRYVVSESTKPVTLATELEYMQRYQVLMKRRYPDQTEVTVQIPPELMNVYVPSGSCSPLWKTPSVRFQQAPALEDHHSGGDWGQALDAFLRRQRRGLRPEVLDG
jgi:hypothetical protein